MFYSVPKDDIIGQGDKKKLAGKDPKDIKKKDPAAPPPDRIILPLVADSVRQERRLALRDAQQKKVSTRRQVLELWRLNDVASLSNCSSFSRASVLITHRPYVYMP